MGEGRAFGAGNGSQDRLGLEQPLSDGDGQGFWRGFHAQAPRRCGAGKEVCCQCPGSGLVGQVPQQPVGTHVDKGRGAGGAAGIAPEVMKLALSMARPPRDLISMSRGPVTVTSAARRGLLDPRHWGLCRVRNAGRAR